MPLHTLLSPSSSSLLLSSLILGTGVTTLLGHGSIISILQKMGIYTAWCMHHTVYTINKVKEENIFLPSILVVQLYKRSVGFKKTTILLN